MTIYEVTGRHPYNGHQPGTTFEATLAEPVEARALARGSITVRERSTPALVPGSFTHPTTTRDPDSEGTR